MTPAPEAAGPSSRVPARADGYPHRVAMVSLHTSPLEVPGVGDAGGLNVYVTEVARRLAERGLEVDVFTRRTDPAAPAVVEMGERIRAVSLVAGPVAPVAKEDLPQLVGPFARALGDVTSGYDLLHSHYWLSGLAAVAVAARHGLPLVHTMHTMALVKNAARGPRSRLEPTVRVTGEADIVAAADMLTANTADEANELIGLYRARPDQIVTVPPGVDLHTFHPCDRGKSRAQLGIAQDAQVVLFVGRIQPLKAPDVLISAVARLLQAQPGRAGRLRLVLIGSPSGPDAAWLSELRRLAAGLGLHDVVDFRPHSPRAELFRWYCVSDVVAVPSYNESFGLVALEAQACGRPVVATDVGGLRHAVDDQQTGVLVPGHDPENWAAALAAILDDPELAARLGANGAVHASRFSWDNSAAATLSAYARARQARQARTVGPTGGEPLGASSG